MKSKLEIFFEQFLLKKEFLAIAGDSELNGADFSFSPNSNSLQTFNSYFDLSLGYSVMETQAIQLISQIQQTKKTQIKIENWDNEEIKIRLVKLEHLIRSHQDSIATVEAHFQGTAKTLQIQATIQPLLELIAQLLSKIEQSGSANPKGLVGAITPKANSFFEIGWRVLFTLYHKDALIIKPATETAVSGILWQLILGECDIPANLISFVFGPGKTIGRFLMDHPGIRHLSFSGSYETLKSYPLSLEKKYQFYFNGKNSLCILPDCDLEKNIKSILKLLIENNGKGVQSLSRIFILESSEKDFKDLLVKELNQVPTLKSVDDEFGFLPLRINEKVKLIDLKSKFLAEEAKLLFENENFLFFSDLPNCSEWHQENQELPAVNLNAVKYTHEMARWVNNSSFGHSLVIFGSEEKAKKLMQKSEVGKVFLNPTSAKNILFSPMKLSGFGDVGFSLPNPFFCFYRADQ